MFDNFILLNSTFDRGSTSHLFCGVFPNLIVNNVTVQDGQSFTPKNIQMYKCRNKKEGVSFVTDDGFGLRFRVKMNEVRRLV